MNSQHKAMLAFLEFLTMLTLFPIPEIGPAVGGASGLALILTLYSLLVKKGEPSQGPKNDRNLN